MIKKIFIYGLFCIILLSMAGCTENIMSALPTDNDFLCSPKPSAVESERPTVSDQSINNTPQHSSIPSQSETTKSTGADRRNNCKLIVEGKDITFGKHVVLNYEHHYAEIPLTAVIKELGIKVEWQDKTKAKIIIDDKDYILDTTKGSLSEAGGGFNILVVAPGSRHDTFYQVVGNEFVVDSDSAKLLLANILHKKIIIDYDDKIVSIG